MLEFGSASGSISFEDAITLYFDKNAFLSLADEVGKRTTFEIYFTDGTLSLNDIAHVEFGDGDWEITDIEDGKLIVNGIIPEVDDDDVVSGGGNSNGNGSNGNGGSHGSTQAPPMGKFEKIAYANSGAAVAISGARLLDQVEQEQRDETLTKVNRSLERMLKQADAAPAAQAQEYRTQAAKVMAAVAGSTVTSLGAAQRDATRGELLRLRSYAHAQLAAAPKGEEMPVHVWLEASGGYNKLNADGDLSGYTLNSWGGTLGAAMAPSKDTLLGLALTAQYGDLEATAADSAKGDLDGYYLSAFARLQSGKWGHVFIATVGTHDATLNRTVDYGTGSYSTQGSTDGTAFGAVYELTYDVALAEDKSSILQPLVNLSIVSASMGGYSEEGAGGAGLRVDDQKWTTSSIAAGVRWLGRVGSGVFGSEAQAELRLSVAQDMGDTQGSAQVGLLANPGYRQEVKGAEIGSTAVQLGGGLAVPVGAGTQVYVNANAELRSGATSWGAAAGVRLSF